MGPELTALALAAVSWLAGLRLLGRMAAGCRRVASIPEASVSIVIPARNEAHNLPRLLLSLREGTLQPKEILVVDDESSDATARVAREGGARVIASRPLPAGWLGKSWACFQGAEAATGNLLLFVDADAWFQSEGLARILEARRGGAVAVCPYHEVVRPYEELSAFFHSIMLAAILPDGLFGQCLLMERADYRRSGGHGLVRSEILEHVKLARQLRDRGIPTRSLCGRGRISFRMYPGGLRELVAGWTKGFAAGAAETPPANLALIVVWLGGLFTAPFALKLGPVGVGIYLAFALQWFAMLTRVGNYSLLTALVYPVPLGFYLAIFLRSLGSAGRKAVWKGRNLHDP